MYLDPPVDVDAPADDDDAVGALVLSAIAEREGLKLSIEEGGG